MYMLKIDDTSLSLLGVHYSWELVKERRQNIDGCEITEVRWRESRHCTHLIDNRDAYLEAWMKFLRVARPAPIIA
jgi:hypothetical protein